MGKTATAWQNKRYILGLFGDKVLPARRHYRVFVEAVLSEAREAYERKYRLKANGIDVDSVAHRVAKISGIESSQFWASGKQPKIVQARSLLCYWATSELGITQAWLSKRLRFSQPAISLSVARGRAIAIKINTEYKTYNLTYVPPLVPPLRYAQTSTLKKKTLQW